MSTGHINTFQALIARQHDDSIEATVETLDESELPPAKLPCGFTIPASTTRTHSH